MSAARPLLLLALLAGCEQVIGIDDLEVVRTPDGGAPADGGEGGAAGASASDGGACPKSCVGDGTECGDCIQQSCCCEALDCSLDAVCSTCLGSTLPAVCSADALFAPYLACARRACKAQCGL